MVTPNQRTPGRTVVEPNTLTGEAEPNTLSSMTGRPATGRGAPRRPQAASAPRTVPSPLLRLMSWVLILIVAFVILSILGR